MKEIKLANNKGIALVDDEDYELVSKYKWHMLSATRRYARAAIKIETNKYIRTLMHKLIMDTKEHIDHIDSDGLNNQRSNLRIATQSNNMMNASKQNRGSSRHKGVCWQKKNNKWTAYITLNKIRYYLGIFIDENKAAEAYNIKAEELFGEYAKLNIIED